MSIPKSKTGYPDEHIEILSYPLLATQNDRLQKLYLSIGTSVTVFTSFKQFQDISSLKYEEYTFSCLLLLFFCLRGTYVIAIPRSGASSTPW